jgi:hypothetical protein
MPKITPTAVSSLSTKMVVCGRISSQKKKKLTRARDAQTRLEPCHRLVLIWWWQPAGGVPDSCGGHWDTLAVETWQLVWCREPSCGCHVW